MSDDLRTRLEDVLATTTAGFVPKGFERLNARHGEGEGGHIYDGACALCRGEIGSLLDAIMPVVEEKLWRANWTRHGKCRFCDALILEDWVCSRGRQVQPHRMHCRFYIGPVEHRDVHGRQAATHWSTECSCGRSRNAEREVTCPNTGEVWRGPMPGRET